jgi:hypothetical protein
LSRFRTILRRLSPTPRPNTGWSWMPCLRMTVDVSWW